MKTTLKNESKTLSTSICPSTPRTLLRGMAWLMALLAVPMLGACGGDEETDQEMVNDASSELSTEICNGIDDDFDFLVDEGGVCQFGARQRQDNHEYLLGDEPLSWETAREACLGRGFDLVKIEGALENAWLAAFAAADQRNRWIGLSSTDANDGYRWTDGSFPLYTNWMPWKVPMPGMGDVYMNAGGYWWIDSSASLKIPLFCELMDPVSFINSAGVTTNGTWLTKTGGPAWNAGAASAQSIADGDGFVQFTTGEINKSKAAGLGVGDSSQHYNDIDYAIRLDANGNIYVDEAGVNRGMFGPYAADDVFRVEVLNSKVRYLRNEVVFYTSSLPPSYPLLLDSSLYHTGATLGDARLKACGVKMNGQPCIEPGYWDNAVAVFAGTNASHGHYLVRAPGTGWAGGAVSFDSIASGDGYMEFQTKETNLSKAAGLAVGDSSQHYNDIDFAIRLDANGNIYVDELGVNKGSFGAYAVGDVFRVEVLNGHVRYVKNGVVFHSSTAPLSYPLRLDTSLYHGGATISNASIKACSNCISPGAWNNVMTAFAGTNPVDGDYLTRGPGTAWAAGASSFASIDAGDGYMEFQTDETNLSKAAGLAVGDDSQHYNDIDYAIRLEANGNIYVDELGVNKGVFGPYSTGDVFRVEVLNGQVRYVKNDVVFHTSTAAPAYPLRIDTSLYHGGATIRNASIVACTGCISTGAWLNVFTAFAGSNETDGHYLVRAQGTAWSAGALSSDVIVSGNGYVQFKTNELNKSKAAGLGSGDGSRHYNDIEYAIRLEANGVIYIDESGSNKGSFGPYSLNDVFRVEILNGQVRYFKNTELLRSVAAAPVYPLRLDTSLYHGGATITHAEIGPL